MKIQCFGDSFGLPRFYKHDGFDFDNFGHASSGKIIQLHYEDTYPERIKSGLKEYLPEDDMILINDSAQVYNSFQLYGDFKNAYLAQPDYIVVQVGIVDCSPRAADAYAPFPFMKGKSPWVSAEEYYNNLNVFLSLCRQQIDNLSAIFVVNIVCGSKLHFMRHPGAWDNTLAYNQLIDQLVAVHQHPIPGQQGFNPRVYLVDLFGISREAGYSALCVDGVHINNIGSELLADEIIGCILNDIKMYPSKIESVTNKSIKSTISEQIIASIDQICSDIHNCAENDIPMLTYNLLALIKQERAFYMNNSAKIQEFNLFIDDIIKIIESGNYFELAFMLKCQLKAFLAI